MVICFRDRTYCSFYKECTKGNKCDRALTPEVNLEAEEWWNDVNPPISVFADEPECFNKK